MLLLQVMIGELLLGANYALFSAGLTLIWGMMNFISFAHGEFVMLGMYAALLNVVRRRLAERRHQSAGTLSGGERQMLALGRALMRDPRRLMLPQSRLGPGDCRNTL